MLAKARTHIENARGGKGALLIMTLGLLSVLGHAPFFIWPAFIICMGALLIHLDAIASQSLPSDSAPRKKTGRPLSPFWRGARAGYVFGFGYFLASLYWIASAFITRGTGYILLAPFGMVLLPAGLALFWALAGGIYVQLTKSRKLSGLNRALLFTTLFFMAEFLRGNILSGFPWNLPGYIWPAGGAMSQSASLFGIYGLSYMSLFLASGVGIAVQSGPKRFMTLIISAGLCLGLFSFGVLRLSSAKVEYVDGTYIRVLQTRLDQKTKYSTDGYFEVINKYLDLSRTQTDKPLTHIVWPEGAIPGLPLEDNGLMSAINSVFTDGPDLLMGVTRRELSSDLHSDSTQYYNSLIGLRASFVTGQPEQLGLYNKSRLVPFGEYFPGNELMESWDIPALTKATSSFNFGTPGLTQFPGLPLASVQICYEAIFTGFTPSREKNQAQWILTISNDSWFGSTTGPYQHMNQVQYRAIEEGLPIVRSASSGKSGFIDPYGRPLKSLPLHVEGVIDHPLPKANFKTPYSRLSSFR